MPLRGGRCPSRPPPRARGGFDVYVQWSRGQEPRREGGGGAGPLLRPEALDKSLTPLLTPPSAFTSWFACISLALVPSLVLQVKVLQLDLRTARDKYFVFNLSRPNSRIASTLGALLRYGGWVRGERGLVGVRSPGRGGTGLDGSRRALAWRGCNRACRRGDHTHRPRSRRVGGVPARLGQGRRAACGGMPRRVMAHAITSVGGSVAEGSASRPLLVEPGGTVVRWRAGGAGRVHRLRRALRIAGDKPGARSRRVRGDDARRRGVPSPEEAFPARAHVTKAPHSDFGLKCCVRGGPLAWVARAPQGVLSAGSGATHSLSELPAGVSRAGSRVCTESDQAYHRGCRPPRAIIVLGRYPESRFGGSRRKRTRLQVPALGLGRGSLRESLAVERWGCVSRRSFV